MVFSAPGTSSNGLTLVLLVVVEVVDDFFSGVVISSNGLVLATVVDAGAVVDLLSSAGFSSNGLELKLINSVAIDVVADSIDTGVASGVTARRPFSSKSINDGTSFNPMNFCFLIGKKTVFTSSAVSRF